MARYNNLRYEEALDAIEEYIDRNHLKEDDILPAERKFAEELQLSRGTVREALKALEREGLIYKVHGKGNFIEAERHSITINNMQSFSVAEKKEGNIPSSKVIYFKKVKAGDMLAEKLKIENEDIVYVLCRVRKVNGRAVLLETAYLPLNIVPALEKFDFETDSLYRVLEEVYDIEIMDQELNIQLSRATEQESQHLEIEPEELVYVEKAVARTIDNQIVEYTKSIIAARRAKYQIKLHRSTDILMLDELKLNILCNAAAPNGQEEYVSDKLEDIYWEKVEQVLREMKSKNSQVCFYVSSETTDMMKKCVSGYADYIVLDNLEQLQTEAYIQQTLEKKQKIVLNIRNNVIEICNNKGRERVILEKKIKDMAGFQRKFLFGAQKNWEPIKCVKYALNRS